MLECLAQHNLKIYYDPSWSKATLAGFFSFTVLTQENILLIPVR